MSRNAMYIGGAVVLALVFTLGAVVSGGIDVAGLISGEPEEPAEPGEDAGFEEARPHLEEQLRQQREHELIMEHVDDLRQASEVEKELDAIDAGDETLTVATVNEVEITVAEYKARKAQELQQLMMMGLDPESEEAEETIAAMRPQIVDGLIANEMVRQEAQRTGIKVTDEEISQEYEEFAVQFGGEEELEELLAEEGITREEIKQDMAEGMLVGVYIETYIDENLSEEDLEFSEEELREAYEQQQQHMQPPQQAP